MFDTSLFHVELNDDMRKSFEEYAALLLQYNEKVNLTRITDIGDIYELHFLDSLAGAPVISSEAEKSDVSVIDIGSGAGFPGVPLKIAFPGIRLTLVDSVDKKLAFLRELGVKLKFDDMSYRVVHSRAEDLGRDSAYRESFDFAVMRAVASLPVLLEYALPFLKIGGKLLAYKGPGADDELELSGNALKVLGGKIVEIKKFSLPGGASRTLIVVEKISATPERYPRKAGTPAKKPL